LSQADETLMHRLVENYPDSRFALNLQKTKTGNKVLSIEFIGPAENPAETISSLPGTSTQTVGELTKDIPDLRDFIDRVLNQSAPAAAEPGTHGQAGTDESRQSVVSFNRERFLKCAYCKENKLITGALMPGSIFRCSLTCKLETELKGKVVLSQADETLMHRLVENYPDSRFALNLRKTKNGNEVISIEFIGPAENPTETTSRVPGTSTQTLEELTKEIPDLQDFLDRALNQSAPGPAE